MDTKGMDTKPAQLERAEMQPHVDEGIQAMCGSMNIETLGPPDSDAFHNGRRLARCLIRAGVRIMLKLGAPPDVLMPVLLECAGKEAQAHVECTQFGNGNAATNGPPAQA